MITRNDVQAKLVAIKSNSDLPQDKESVKAAIATWLTTVDFVAANRDKVVADLESYEEYRSIV